MMFKPLAICAIICAAGPVSAQSTAAAITFESCSACHGGMENEIPAIRGRAYDDLVSSLTAYKESADGATIMHRFAVALTGPEIEGLARYISDLEDIPQ